MLDRIYSHPRPRGKYPAPDMPPDRDPAEAASRNALLQAGSGAVGPPGPAPCYPDRRRRRSFSPWAGTGSSRWRPSSAHRGAIEVLIASTFPSGDRRLCCGLCRRRVAQSAGRTDHDHYRRLPVRLAFVGGFAATDRGRHHRRDRHLPDCAQRRRGESLLLMTGARTARIPARHGSRNEAFSYLLFLRLAPVPFWIVNLVPALANVPLRTFFGATVIGIIPATFIFAFFGAGLDGAIAEQAAAYGSCRGRRTDRLPARLRPACCLDRKASFRARCAVPAGADPDRREAMARTPGAC